MITADDWGLSESINEAILDLARSEKLSMVSFMANGACNQYLLSELLETNVKFSLHLNFTEGSPLANPRRLKKILRADDRFRGAFSFYLMIFLRQIPKPDLVLEFTHQIQSASKTLGARLIEIDGHHHAHLSPFFLENVSHLLIQYNIKRIRVPLDWSHFLSACMGRLLFARKHKLTSFELISYGHYRAGMKIDGAFQHYLAHPGRENGGSSSWDKRRVAEYLALKTL